MDNVVSWGELEDHVVKVTNKPSGYKNFHKKTHHKYMLYMKTRNVLTIYENKKCVDNNFHIFDHWLSNLNINIFHKMFTPPILTKNMHNSYYLYTQRPINIFLIYILLIPQPNLEQNP